MAEELCPTGDAPSPFRRFPWVQLAFCLACLTMTAWTWMRYSYAWEFSRSDCERARLYIGVYDGRQTAHVFRPRWPYGRYTVVRGTATEPFGVLENGVYYIHAPGDDEILATVRLHEPADAPVGGKTMDGESKAFCGRLTAPWHEAGPFIATSNRFASLLVIDTTASRFHPASIAGIVVGAMGCLIFGLYLRRWLRERRAA